MKYLWFIIISLYSTNTIAIKERETRCAFYSSNIKVGVNSCYVDKLSIDPDIVYGFSIDGELSILQEDYLVRVLVKAKDGCEYLVMESYKEIQGNIPTQFEDYSEETFLINGIQVDSIKVYTRGANLSINGFRYFPTIQANKTNTDFEELAKNIKDKIRNTKVEKINHYNETHNLLWRAGITWLSQQNYETKKRILGLQDDSSTHGFEYYSGGIIEIDDTEQYVRPQRTYTSYVDNFDWRNRHGKDWMTPVKNQLPSNCCFYFACVGAVEAMTNLYYNQKYDLNLSEQELISCSGLPDPYTNGIDTDLMEIPLNYLANNGVCDSQSYPFANLMNQPCMSWLINPNEQIKVSGYVEIDYTNEDEIKKALINHGPLITGIRSPVWMRHSMVLVGYGKLQAGDTIYHHLWYNHDSLTYVHDSYLTIEEDDPRIGRTYMVYKNSFGIMDSTSNQGYMYVIHNNYTTSSNRTFYLTLPVTSLNYTEDDVVLEDSDGDGYYFWGLGPKPSNCPSWIPNQPDGDDSNYKYGPMDTYGNLEDLEIRGLQTFYLTTDYTFTSWSFLYNNTCVCSMAKLTIKSPVTLYGSTKIIVEPNGELIIDGGVLQNADIELKVRSKLVLKNGGSIFMRDGKNFIAPIGASVIIEDGTLK